MADNSILTSTTGMTSLVDSSTCDTKVTETSKENLFLRYTSYAEGKSITCFKTVNCYFNHELTD